MENLKRESAAVLEAVKRLTSVTVRLSNVSDDNFVLRQDLRREASAFYSHIDLSVKGVHPDSMKQAPACLSRILQILERLNDASSKDGIDGKVVAGLYTALQERIFSSEQTYAAEKNINDVTLQQKRFREENNDAIAQPLTKRQEEILEYVRTHKVFKLKNLLDVFPGLSEKTIRNDLVSLCGHGFIERAGVPPQSHYRIVEHAVSILWDAVPEYESAA